MKAYLSHIPNGACFKSPKLMNALVKAGMVEKHDNKFVPVGKRFGVKVDGFFIEFINLHPESKIQFVELFRKSYIN